MRARDAESGGHFQCLIQLRILFFLISVQFFYVSGMDRKTFGSPCRKLRTGRAIYNLLNTTALTPCCLLYVSSQRVSATNSRL